MGRAFSIIFLVFLGVFACLGAVGSLVLNLYEVPNPSMEPALHPGDRLAEITIYGGARNLNRGELIAFHAPYDPRQVIVRRVVGLPGDRLQVVGGILLLNGKQVYEPYIKPSKDRSGFDFPANANALFDEGELRRLQDLMYAEWVRNGVFIVPQGYYFVLGDNRGNSTDSRNFGPVPFASVLARPLFVYASKAPGSNPRFVESYVIGPDQ